MSEEATESGTVLCTCIAPSLEGFLVLWLVLSCGALTSPVPAAVPDTCCDTHLLLDDVSWGTGSSSTQHCAWH